MSVRTYRPNTNLPCNNDQATGAHSRPATQFQVPTGELLFTGTRWYDDSTQSWLDHDPIEADANSYRYVGNHPSLSVDPTGLLEWQKQVKGEPRIDTRIDYSGKLDQTLDASAGDAQTTLKPGTQSWQFNAIKDFFVITNGETSEVFDPPGKVVLDVNDLGGKTTPIQITDHILWDASLKDDKKIAVAVQTVKKDLGLRPYDNRTNIPLGDALKTGNGRDATKEDVDVLKKNKDAKRASLGAPTLHTEIIFAYVDRSACQTSKESDLKKAKEYIDKLIPNFPKIPDGGKGAVLIIDDEEWFAIQGPQGSKAH